MSEQLRVNEIFLSVQGEGHLVGTPMVFVRLSGCNLDCEWCDTPHQKGDLMSPEMIVNQVLFEVRKQPIRYVCLTGGEPTIQELEPLLDHLHGADFRVCLESNGSRRLSLDRREIFDWVTISPKLQFGVDRWLQRTGDEVKIPIGKDFPSVTHLEEVRDLGNFEFWFLQPIDDVDFQSNAKRSLRLACEDPQWRISAQMHKRLGLR